MTRVETILGSREGTAAITSALAAGVPNRNMDALWKSGLSSSLLFSVGDRMVDPSAENEARRIIERYAKRNESHQTGSSMSSLVDFQKQLQMKSKIITAIEMLIQR